jgi:hypothetical protein
MRKGRLGGESNMTHIFQRIDPFPLKSLNCRQAVKSWSKEELVELAKKALKADMNLDFLLELNPRDLEILVACIRARMECLQES